MSGQITVNFNGRYQVQPHGERSAGRVSVDILSHLFRSLIIQAPPAAEGIVAPKKQITTCFGPVQKYALSGVRFTQN